MGIVILLFSFEQVILSNGIEIIPISMRKYALLIGFPENKIPSGRQYDTGLVLKEFEKGEELVNYISHSLKAYPSKPIGFRFKHPILNLLFGMYASDRGFSLLKVFIPEDEQERFVSILDTLPDTLVAGEYNLDNLEPGGGFFIVPSKAQGYYNLPPDTREMGYLRFLFLMEIIKERGFTPVFSKTGRKIPFYIKGDLLEILGCLGKGIGEKEMEDARRRVLSFYRSIKNDPLKRAIFLSVSGVNPEDFDLRWKDWILILDRDVIEELRLKYQRGGIFAVPPQRIPYISILLPGSIIDS